MITYDQANELKLNGFPQRGWGFRACEHNKEALKHVQRCDCQMVDLVSVPSLGELLKELGDDFFQLTYWQTKYGNHTTIWCAEARMEITKELAKGDNPEEALYKLWLLIKKK